MNETVMTETKTVTLCNIKNDVLYSGNKPYKKYEHKIGQNSSTFVWLGLRADIDMDMFDRTWIPTKKSFNKDFIYTLYV